MRKGNAGWRKIAKVNLLRERSRKFVLIFFMTCWPMFVKLWNKRDMMLVYMIASYYVGTQISQKIRERSAKGPRKDAMVQVHQSPCKVSMLKATLSWRKPDVSCLFVSCSLPILLLSSFHFLSIFVSSCSGGRMMCVKRRWANTLPMPHLVFLMSSHVTTGFSLSPRKVRERGCCSMDCANATVVAAKVKRKDSRKTHASTKSLDSVSFFSSNIRQYWFI